MLPELTGSSDGSESSTVTVDATTGKMKNNKESFIPKSVQFNEDDNIYYTNTIMCAEDNAKELWYSTYEYDNFEQIDSTTFEKVMKTTLSFPSLSSSSCSSNNYYNDYSISYGKVLAHCFKAC